MQYRHISNAVGITYNFPLKFASRGGEAVKRQQIKSLAGVKWEPRFCMSLRLHYLVYAVVPAQSLGSV